MSGRDAADDVTSTIPPTAFPDKASHKIGSIIRKRTRNNHVRMVVASAGMHRKKENKIEND